MTERTPLLHYRLSASVNESEFRAAPAGLATQQHPVGPRMKSSLQRQQPKKLSVFFGVVIPTLLSMFSVVVFLRIGFMVGHSGLYQAIFMFLVMYFIICMTVLSFGGSIGIMFFLANVCACALYVLGLVEAIIATFGVPEGGSLASSPYQVLPSGYWWSLLYATGVLLLCVLVCMVGVHLYAKATFLIFLVVMFVLGTIFVSFFAVGPLTILTTLWTTQQET
ncbi:hypothetical protein F7725_021161 [Dissostichus mawsoni]|uniref:Uncharacterized protein n=1 Tax=Dissostichus mawsoni TaxID=36200 RepID=A0A7J5YG58_DISMA|nr:hypothetical protein F7725_021161 [Dissostichus mawsoni]